MGWGDALGQVLPKVGMTKTDVMAKYEAATAHISTLKVTAAAHKSTLHDQANAATAGMVAKFDDTFPRYAGAVPKTIGDFLFFVAYHLLVLYVIISVTRKIFKMTLGLYCFSCCCGCLRSRA